MRTSHIAIHKRIENEKQQITDAQLFSPVHMQHI